MAGATLNFSLAFFDFGDALNSSINAALEVDRFVLIDEQLFGLYSIFGNGVISGWTITNPNNDLSVTISQGVGIVNSLACETDFSIDVTDLPPDETVVLYAITTGNTPSNRTVSFNFTAGVLPETAIPLANLTTGDTNVITIDTSVMQTIGFQQIITYEVDHHHHTGLPSKIQLDLETRGLLPGSRIAPLDASILQSGKIPISQLPQINHNALENIGLLTHPQLDSLVNSVQANNEQLLGEVSSINLMKAIVFQKYKDPEMDQFFVNELAIIPGISPDSFIDWNNTTANVDETNQCISGLPADLILPGLGGGTDGTQGNLSVVLIDWATDTDFRNASVINNLVIDDGVSLLSNSLQNLTLEDFETVATGPAGGYNGSLNETTSVAAAYDNSTFAQGLYSGRFETKHTYSSTFIKTYTTSQDWSQYNQLVLYVKSYSASHAAVYMEIDDANGNVITTFTLLATDEITSTGNLATNGFAQKTFSLSGLTITNIGAIKIYTANITTSDEIFYVDNIYLQNTGLVMPQGTLRLRYTSSTPVLFRSIDYIANIPNGCDFRVRERVGNDIQSLLSAPFSTRLNAGDVFSTVGTEIEIDITFYSDSTQTKTPVLTFVELQIMVQSQDSGFTINDASSFNNGTMENIAIGTSQDNEVFLNLQYTNVGDMYFLYNGIVNEIDQNYIPQFGVNGGMCPIAPLQAYNTINGNQSSGLSNATSVYRLQTANYLIADTGNDRVIETLPTGEFLQGFGCHNRDYDINTYGLTAVYNPVLGILFITFSMQVPLESYDLTTIHLNWNSNILTLDNSSDQRQNLLAVPITYNTNPSSVTFDRVLAILLSQNHQNILSSITSPIYVKIDGDSQLNYIPCFVGDFTYYGRGAILRPIFANEIEAGKWIIANSAIFHGYDDIVDGSFNMASPTGYTISGTALTDYNSMLAGSSAILSVIDDTSAAATAQSFGTTDFTFNGIVFSDITLGGIYPLPNEKFVIAGLQLIPTTTTTTTSTTPPANDTARMSGYQGLVIAIDKSTSKILFTYQSPEGLYPSDVYVDENGLYVIAETSLIPQAGRIIKVDTFGNISAVISNGMYTKINDIRPLTGNHMLVST